MWDFRFFQKVEMAGRIKESDEGQHVRKLQQQPLNLMWDSSQLPVLLI